jgi:tetratricopeptide (TPR) repeat protein/transcriptional regulator with XRE-family HTH domain
MSQARGEPFGVVLRRLRIAAGLTQEELAERAHLSWRGISDLERGARRAPYRDTVRLLSEALALSPEQRAALERAARRRDTTEEPPPAPPAASTPVRAPPARPLPPLVGRMRELALLERHLAGEGPPVLLLAGEPGIGKSRLLAEATERAVGQGWRVLTGGCQRRGGQEPYAPLLGALKGHLARTDPDRLRAELQGCAWLVRLLPELAAGPIAPLPTWTVPPEQERRLLGEAVLRYLTNVAGPAGTLLLLDDLHWAGPDALDLLGTLMRAPAEAPLRVVGAYRDTEVQPQDTLAVLLADLAHAALVAHQTLAPLSVEEVRHLLDELLAGTGEDRAVLRERVVQRTGGVPFFAVSYAQGLRAGALERGAEDAVPWDVAQGIRQRVAALPADTRTALGVAAVIGRRVPLKLLAAVAARPEAEILDTLEAAGQAGLLVAEERGAYQFVHDVIREVVEAELGAVRRAQVHRQVAEALEAGAEPCPAAVLAYHYGRSGAQEKAMLYLERAGDQASAQAAHAAAESYYSELADALAQLGRPLDLARIEEKLGAVVRAMGRYDAALGVLERAAETYETRGDLEGLGRVTAQMGIVYYSRGAPEVGVRRLQPVLGSVEAGGPSPTLAALYVGLADLYHVSGQYVASLAEAERAATMARAVGADGVLARAEVSRGIALSTLGQSAEVLRVLEEAIPLAEAAEEPFALFGALHVMAYNLACMGNVAASRLYEGRAVAVAERVGDTMTNAFVLANRGAFAFWAGEWGQAREDTERALALNEQVGASYGAPYVLLYRGELRLAEGWWDEASRYLEQAVALAAPRGDLQALRKAQRALAERDVLAGQPAAACARLEPLLDRPGLAEHDVTELLPVLAWAYLECGAVEQAAEVAAQAGARARALHHQLALVEALRVQALVACRQGQWGQATRALEEGLTLARSIPYPYAEGRLLQVDAEVHLGQGAVSPARERWEAALAIFRRLGARKDSERVEQELATLEVGSP